LKIRYLYIILLLCILSGEGYGQSPSPDVHLFSVPISADGLEESLEVNLEKRTSVSFEEGVVVITESVNNLYIIIRVKFNSSATEAVDRLIDLKIESSAFLSMPKKLYKESWQLSPSKATTLRWGVDFEKGTQTGMIKMVFTLPDKTIQERRIGVRLQAAPGKADGSSCTGIPSERLKCLQGLKSTHPKVLEGIETLKTERKQEEAELEKWELGVLGDNVYNITCNLCRKGDFSFVGANKERPVSISTGWKIRVNKNRTLTLASDNWPEFDLKVEEDRSNETEVDTGGEVQVTNGSTINVAEEEEVLDTPLITKQIEEEYLAFSNRFWEDSIANSLKLDALLNLDEETRSRLNKYRKSQEGRADRKLVAWCFLNPYLALGSVLAVLLVGCFFLFRKRGEKVELPVETKKEAAAAVSQIEPPATTPLKREEESDDKIMFEEVVTEVDVANLVSLAEVTKDSNYASIDLTTAWLDTSLTKIHFKASSILAIGEMLAMENAYNPELDNVEELSEIGGFLLGHVFPQNDTYELAIATFIPITPEQNDRYTVKFGDEAWVELDDAMKEFPSQRLVGWFHTHPGHGLFLSNADIKVHSNTFLKPYHFAMEIDPVTPECDIAFFTWKKDGTLNNVQDRRMSQWWSFRNLLHRAQKAIR